MRIDRILLTAALLVAIGATSCQRDAALTIDNATLPTDPREAVVRVRIASEVLQETKSDKFSEEDVSRINNVVVYAVESSTGAWKREFIPSVTASSALAEFSFFQGSEITLYAVANMGDVSFPLNDQGKLLPEQFAYDIPNNANLAASGVPMAKKIIIPSTEFVASNMTNSTASSGTGRIKELSVEMPLERLMARVVVGIDKSNLTGGVDTPVLTSATIAIRQANRHLCPFSESGSYARTADDLFAGAYSVFDVDSFADSPDAMSHSGVVLYVPENRQGEITGDWSTDSPSDLNGQGSLCTYIEYIGYKDGSDDGVDGDVYYRGFLGGSSSDHDNFSIERNKSYTASLSLTWNGLIWNADGWRINADDVTDGRRLVLSSSNNSSSIVAGNFLGKIKREASRQVYVNFSRDGGSTWVHGLKDVPEWPYGWDFYIDGVKQYTGVSGTAQGQIGWSYAGSSSSDELTVTPGAMSTLGSSHTLQVKSKDGSVVSNVVSFEIGVPLTLIWRSSVVPGYVAQRGELVPQDLENPSAEVVYSVTSGNETNVRFTSTGNSQTKYVGLLKPGTVTIHASCAATGQEADIEVAIAAPEMAFDYTAFYANPDGGEATTGATGLSGSYPVPYYHVPGDTQALSRSASSAVGVMAGEYFAQDLYDELLAFTPTIANGFGFLSASSESGYGAISVHVSALTSGAFTYPTKNAGTNIGTLTVSPKVAETGVTPATAAILSVNPFSLFTDESNIPVVTDKDIQDVSITELGGMKFYKQWGYEDTKEYSTYCQSVYASSQYYGIEAFLNNDNVSLPRLTQVFTGNPGGYIRWKQVDKSRGTENGAGIVNLKAFVKNRYSNEKCYSPVFYKGRIFRHGAVVAYVTNPDYNYTGAHIMRVSARYYGDPNPAHSVYPSDGLGCAFPDIGTDRTNTQYYITWSNYEQGMISNEGSTTVTVNPKNRKVTGVDSNGNGIGYLFDVNDDCWNNHSTLDVATCHESYFWGAPGDVRNTGKPGVGQRGAMMKFLSAIGAGDKEILYENHIKKISDELVFLKPTDGATHKYMGIIDGCGFYVLHILNGFIQDEWL